MASQRVKPRHAASLVLYRKAEKDRIEILMGKRAKGHRFLPDVFVFPGGRVDDDDHLTTCSRSLPPAIAKRLSEPGDMAKAIACAAVRETFEETGLVIGDVQNGELVPDLSGLDYIARAITPSESPIRFNTRFLMTDAGSIKGTLGGSGELTHLGWYGIEEALNMPVVDVTEFVLEELRHHFRSGRDRVSRFSHFTYIKGRSVIRQETV